MFCTNCGKSLKEGAAFCIGCGKEVKAAQKQPVDQPKSTQKPVSEPDIMPEAEPVSSNTDTDRVYARGRENVSDRYNGKGSSYSVRENPSAQQHTTAQTQSTMPKRNGLAIGAFIVSFFLPILGLILGIVSMSKIKKTGQRGRGLAISSIVLGAVFAVINTILIVMLLVPVVTCAREGSFDCWFCQIIYPQEYGTLTLDNGDVAQEETVVAEVETVVLNSRLLIGTWELEESSVLGASDVVVFRSDGTGTMHLGVLHEDFSWSLDGDDLIIYQFGLLSIYTITVLNDSTLSYEADLPGVGFVQVTYIRERAVGMMQTKRSNLRSGPGTDYSVLAALLPGTSVEVLEYQADGWSRIRHNGTVGFIRSDFLMPLEGATNQNRTAVEYLDAQDQGELYAAIAEVRDMGFDLAITAHGETIVYTYTYLELIYTDAFELDESGVSAQAELILSDMGDFGAQNPVVRFIFRNSDGEILFQRDFWIVS